MDGDIDSGKQGVDTHVDLRADANRAPTSQTSQVDRKIIGIAFKRSQSTSTGGLVQQTTVPDESVHQPADDSRESVPQATVSVEDSVITATVVQVPEEELEPMTSETSFDANRDEMLATLSISNIPVCDCTMGQTEFSSYTQVNKM